MIGCCRMTRPPFKLTITERVAPRAPAPEPEPPTLEGMFVQLRALYGDNIQTGSSVSSSALDALERELRMKLPADYRAFIERYGYLCAGPRAEVIVYGVADACSDHVHVVD